MRSVYSIISIAILAGAAYLAQADYIEDLVQDLPKPVPGSNPVQAVQGLASRVLGDSQASKFYFKLGNADPSGRDVFTLANVDGQASNGVSGIEITGNSGVAIASGLFWYLKHRANCTVSWGLDGTGDQVDLPAQLPSVADDPSVASVTTTSQVLYRYSWNVCTESYSAAFWDWPRWERELDWLALQGVNLPLAFVGQEAVWWDFFSSLGVSDEGLDAYFSGPAFLAWQRMGNIKGWGGPLDKDWREGQLQLQTQILQRMRELGMMPVLPGFSGHVPAGLTSVYPQANFSTTRSWGNFNSTYSEVTILTPDQDLFTTLGAQFYQFLTKYMGSSKFYNVDLYNEMEPVRSDDAYLKSANQHTFEAMRQGTGDDDVVFVMQGWLFHEGYWTPERTQAYLSGVPVGNMLILDLNTEASPVWTKYESFYGHAWAWCMLHNYGGRRGLYGNISRITTGPIEDNPLLSSSARAAKSTMVAIGITPEAIEQNPVMYEVLYDMPWRTKSPAPADWTLAYSNRRYGTGSSPSTHASDAWLTLLEGAYQYHWNWGHTSDIEYSPAVTMSVNKDMQQATAYTEALRSLVAAGTSGQVNASHVGPYNYDVIDLARQVTADFFVDVHDMFEPAFYQWQMQNVNSTDTVAPLGQLLLDIIADLDGLLGTNVNYLFGAWQHAARNSPNTNTDAERANREYNARNQVTLWGPSGQINDYAAKQWNGLVSDYYGARWELFVTTLTDAVRQGTHVDFNQYGKDLLALEQKWNAGSKTYPDQPTPWPPGAPAVPPLGSSLSLQAAQAILDKYATASSAVRARFTELKGTDYPGNDIIEKGAAWTTDVDQLMLLCDVNPSCKGFNSNGYLKNSTSTKVSSPASFWVKSG